MTRITNSMMTRTLLADLNGVTDRLAKTQQKLSSGKELTVPSDDPFGVSRALQFRADLAANHQFQRNVEDAAAWQAVTDTALDQITAVTLRARELVIRGGSDSVNTEGRGAIAIEIDQLVEAVKAEANANFAGRYVFSGTATLTAPFVPGADDTYQGNADLVRREIGPGVQIPVNVVGQDVLGDGTTSGLVHTLRRIAEHLRSGDAAALRGADLADLDEAHVAILGVRAEVGARTNRLETASGRLHELEESATRLLSETEDADIARTLVEFSMQQTVYQSALKAGAQIIQPSLIDFLR